MSQGTLFQVQRWSIHDGEGIRTTVFFKGCPLRCVWCANPESWSFQPTNGFGYHLSIPELMAELQKDEVFFRMSSGGISFSGGEPFAQAEFLHACLLECRRRGYTTTVETCGHFDWKHAGKCMEHLDAVFFDIKHMDANRHRELTGKDNRQILENAERILSIHPNVTIRVPLVRGYNDSEENITKICGFLTKLPDSRGIEFLPYHNLGVSKYATLGLPEPPFMAAPDQEVFAALQKIVRNAGIAVVTP